MLAESLVFCAWMGIQNLIVLTLLVVLHYAAARLQERVSVKGKRVLCGTAMILTVGVLAAFKFFQYAVDLINRLMSMHLSGIEFLDVMPLGLSYYSFKLISYQADVYRGKVCAERNFIDFSVYAVLFPQMLVGPIMRYSEAQEELHQPKTRCTLEKFTDGACLFVFGLAKKVILADSIGKLWLDVAAAENGLGSASALLVWLGIIAYSLQLYFDFSGFSDMSNGLLGMFGFSGKKNFHYPYTSRSITEFWSRWHISLSHWFRDYVYISLGGNRRGWKRQVFNMLVVWLLTGLWHCTGFKINFLVWGMYYFILLVLEKRFLLPYLKNGRIWPHLYVLAVVIFGWGIFACSTDQITMSALLSGMFRFNSGIPPVFFLRNYGIVLILGVIFSTEYPICVWNRVKKIPCVQPAVVAVLLLTSIACIVSSSSSVALYMGF